MAASKKVFVLGGTGTAGRSTLPVLVKSGYEVTAHARSHQKGETLRAAGANPAVFDNTDTARLRDALSGHEAVIDLRVAIPPYNRAAMPGAWREYVRVRDSYVGLLVESMLQAGIPRLVHDTVTFVYQDGGERWLDEASPVSAQGVLTANLACEAHVARITSAGGNGVALRFGLFYGPDNVMSRGAVQLARRGFATVIGRPEGWQSAIHTDDIGSAVVAALDLPSGVYNVVDEDPIRRRDLLELLASSAGRRKLRHPPQWLARIGPAPIRTLARSQRVSAARFRELTGWRPTVPSQRVGWPQAFSAHH